MYETYPKSEKHPCIKVGEQEYTTWDSEADGEGKVDYPGVGASATAYQGDKNHTKHCSGGNGSPAKTDYPGTKYEKFASEQIK